MNGNTTLTTRETTDEKQTGTPFAPQTDEDVAAMLEAIGVSDVDELFDIPDAVRFDESFDIDAGSEQTVVRELTETLERNDAPIEFLGRGHYAHHVPSLVDHISLRSEFITSYTQYQPEITQGFLQVLFEYQSLLVELTGLEIANCSMYDAATALGEAATLADRVRETTGDRILVPDYIRAERRDVLENYVAGADLVVEELPADDGVTTPEILEEAIDDDVVMTYLESPTTDGVLEEHLEEIGEIVSAHDGMFCLGTDPVALALLRSPADVGVDVVVGDASVLGMGPSYGMGLGLFACREAYLRQVPGRLVGASRDDDGNRAFTLTLQTREQHIRRERATSNICTNQAWVALRAAIHAASLGPSGLVSLAKRCHRLAEQTASRLEEIEGVSAPVRDRHHFREFRARVDDANAVATAIEANGFAIHVVDEETVQICVSDRNEHRIDELVDAFTEVVN
ncbi:aminomethyl-transferring glycine dehydrogenase subunit GcvPA [Salinadaptatus halalkaliphilus]|uniref:Aminomethyl-transferring glycine dehydrogenase subunit GcvPA n=1 Tax=Salinadaptatus halalkaliphilus TaxID=2419781 RepID=A0A4S3TH11_9EURY|nr:aminomethyl-transferring glycine dehydrogenase subunit GcvPA [Salinadaptatus halalkaliphilus]THE63176.1 aminomethyl-transferring glycine dehydrogenase subunit GcvPA [Salinadaptatus halalkaliphilus]